MIIRFIRKQVSAPRCRPFPTSAVSEPRWKEYERSEGGDAGRASPFDGGVLTSQVRAKPRQLQDGRTPSGTLRQVRETSPSDRKLQSGQTAC